MQLWHTQQTELSSISNDGASLELSRTRKQQASAFQHQLCMYLRGRMNPLMRVLY